MAIKKRNVAGNETIKKSNQGGIKSSVSNEKLVDEKERQYEVELDAFDKALAKASENRRKVKEIHVKEKKAQPKVEVG